MKRREFISTLGLGSLAMGLPSLGFANPREKKKRPPNFVVIMADDMDPDSIGCLGTPPYPTPNIDGIAARGTAFNTCWAAPICVPSRAMLLTGLYAHRTGCYHNGLVIPKPDRQKSVYENHLTFSRLLSQHNYKTAVAGKWQLPGVPDDPRYGFDEYCIWATSKETRPKPGEFKGEMETTRLPSRYWHPGINRNGKLMKTSPSDFGPDIYTEFLLDFIKKNRNHSFLAYYPMALPHRTRKGYPMRPDPGSGGFAAKEAYDKRWQGDYHQCCRYVDDMVGRITHRLAQLGLLENTYIVFATDNPHRYKNMATANGARVPLVIAGPGIDKSFRGAVSNQLVSLGDVFPTLAELAGIDLPNEYGADGKKLDGKSLVPLLTGKTKNHRDWLYSYLGTAAMLRDKEWLLEGVDAFMDRPNGRFYQRSDSQKKWVEVTNSTDPKVKKARERFAEKLKEFPPPDPQQPEVEKRLKRYRHYRFKHRF